MTRALDPNDRGISSQDDDDSLNKEILPDTIEGILLRMAEELKCSICLATMEEPVSTGCNHIFCNACVRQALDHKGGCPLCKNPVTKRSLNKLDHLESVIKAYQNLREAYEQEVGIALSQAPRYYHSEPQENLTQLYPYAEKSGDALQAAPASPTTQSKTTSALRTTLSTATPPNSTPHQRQQRLQPQLQYLQQAHQEPALVATSATLATHSGTQRNNDLPEAMDLDAFETDLDTVSAEQAAALATKMLAIMSLYSSQLNLNDIFSNPTPITPSHSQSQPPPKPRQPTSSQPARTSQVASVPQREATPQPLMRQRSSGDMIAIKLEPTDIVDQPTLPPQSDPPLLVPKEEPASQSTGADTTLVTESVRASKEKDIVLSGTNLTSAKKLRLENAAKALKAKTIDDLSTRPTHVVLNITEKQCAGGGGRTVKFFLGLLRASWVLRFEWVEASMEAGFWVEEEPFLLYDNEFGNNGARRSRASHAREEPKLLEGYEVQLTGAFIKPLREEMELMIRAGGGTVVQQLFRNENRAQDVYTISTVPPAKKHLVVFDQANEGVLKVKKLRTDIEVCMDLARPLGKKVDVVTCGDLLNSIAQYNMRGLANTSI